MPTDWGSIFDRHGAKRVSVTDKEKGAYVPNTEQKAAMAAAGLQPSSGAIKATHQLGVLNDLAMPLLVASYYNAERAGAGRQPEPRMGQGLITWVDVGDVLIIGNIGSKVFVAKEYDASPPAQDVGRELADKLDKATVLAKAKQATGKPAQRQRSAIEFKRNPYVVAAAIVRANGACEMPGCVRQLFQRDDGSAFLEVHHVIPLAEGGDDTLVNVAAICPACHREVHHGVLRQSKQAALAEYVAAVTATLGTP